MIIVHILDYFCS